MLTIDLLENLRATQSFDLVMRRSPTVDAIVDRVARAILYVQDDEYRSRQIDRLADQLAEHFADTAMPAAHLIGQANARRVLRGLGANPLSDATARKAALYDLKLRSDDRVRIIQHAMDDLGNTLDNRLAAYWLEPGADTAEKLRRLRQIHDQMEAARARYEARLQDYYRGARPNRPSRPQLDYTSRLTHEAKQNIRVQARRAGTDAELAEFRGRGFRRFNWVTVNAEDACPDCRSRNGEQGDLAYWDQRGRPGAGQTICGSACFCMLVPVETVTMEPTLARGLTAAGLRE